MNGLAPIGGMSQFMQQPQQMQGLMARPQMPQQGLASLAPTGQEQQMALYQLLLGLGIGLMRESGVQPLIGGGYGERIGRAAQTGVAAHSNYLEGLKQEKMQAIEQSQQSAMQAMQMQQIQMQAQQMREQADERARKRESETRMTAALAKSAPILSQKLGVPPEMITELGPYFLQHGIPPALIEDRPDTLEKLLIQAYKEGKVSLDDLMQAKLGAKASSVQKTGRTDKGGNIVYFDPKRPDQGEQVIVNGVPEPYSLAKHGPVRPITESETKITIQQPHYQLTPFLDSSGNPTKWDPRTGIVSSATVEGGGTLEKPQSAESAGRATMVEQAAEDMGTAIDIIFPDGNYDLRAAAGVFMNLGEKGRIGYSALRNAIAAKLRLETGAQANESEIHDIMSRYRPVPYLDNAVAARNKLERLQDFMTRGKYAIRPSTRREKEVEVIAPDGTEGTIPSSQLQKAISKGYKVK